VCAFTVFQLLPAEAAANPEDAAEARERKAVLLEEIQENIGEAARYRADIAANEACRREIQAKIETAIDANSNVNFLKILSTFRIQVCNCRLATAVVVTVYVLGMQLYVCESLQVLYLTGS
jgi:hypothetical protein